eukprot:UN07141
MTLGILIFNIKPNQQHSTNNSKNHVHIIQYIMTSGRTNKKRIVIYLFGIF